jgi:hypothetical protein
MTLGDIRNAIQSVDATEPAVQKCAESFSRLLWEHPGLPPEFLEFCLELLSTPALFSKPGIWHFLFELNTEYHRLDEAALERLRRVLESRYVHYADEMLRHMVCDFVARRFPAEEALDILETFARFDREPAKAHVGLEIVLTHLKRDHPSYPRATGLLRSVLEADEDF